MGTKISRLGYLGPHPLFPAKSGKNHFAENTQKLLLFLTSGNSSTSLGILAPTPYSEPKSGKNYFAENTNKTSAFLNLWQQFCQFKMFFSLNSIYLGGGQDTLGGGQDTPAGVSWPPPTIPSQKVGKIILPRTHKTSAFLIICQQL